MVNGEGTFFTSWWSLILWGNFLPFMDRKIHTDAKIRPFDSIMSKVNLVHTLAISKKLTLLLLCSLRIGLTVVSYLVTFWHKVRRHFSFCVGVIHPTYLIPLDLIILRVFSETYKLCSSSYAAVCSRLLLPVFYIQVFEIGTTGVLRLIK